MYPLFFKKKKVNYLPSMNVDIWHEAKYFNLNSSVLWYYSWQVDNYPISQANKVNCRCSGM